ncbi:putative cholinesterase 2 [Apostichopus japonicus]|uniref:Carboxylic ester hydrolase n=1 Tax=Stichopus japonicus TaxID=307972 RepID=A0A2G8JZ27_STIJA|nr:putative cholinesterase 2 [Apostichopus japonicus]
MFLFITTVLTAWHLTAGQGNPVVNINNGAVVGETVRFTESTYISVDKDINVFRGIPFAEPPVGSLRWQNPVPKSNWVGTWNATYYRPICPQALPSKTGNEEDCLYLNLYAPAQVPVEGAAVMVFIYGGAFNVGWAHQSTYIGTALAATGDVIVVAANYRLGVLGFLSTGDSASPGNYGMYDQVATLQWVQDNIAAFGGDPARVTIFGQSAGGCSVGLHVLSPVSQNLFQYAIMESGTALTPFAYNGDQNLAVSESHRLGDDLNCTYSTNEELMACLRTHSAAEVLATALKFTFLSAPVVDGVFLPDHPETLMYTENFKHTNIIAGTNKDEGLIFGLAEFPAAISGVRAPTMDRASYEESFPKYLRGNVNELFKDGVRNQYIDWSLADETDADYLEAFNRQVTDETFVAPTDAFLRYYTSSSKGGTTAYSYHMTHAPSVSAWQINLIGPRWMEATHCEELQFVFGWPFLDEVQNWKSKNLNSNEKTLSVQIMKNWTNFAKTGDPNSADVPDWSTFTVPELEYKEIAVGLPTQRALRADDNYFWNSLAPALKACA